MKKNKNDIGHLSPELIEQYMKGNLSHEQMHDVERLILDSEFEAEAMEGFEELGAEHISYDLAMLNKKLEERIEREKRFMPFWFKIAASVLVLALTTVIILNIDFLPSEEELAVSEKKAEALKDQSPMNMADSVDTEQPTETEPTEPTEDQEPLLALKSEEKENSFDNKVMEDAERTVPEDPVTETNLNELKGDVEKDGVDNLAGAVSPSEVQAGEGKAETIALADDEDKREVEEDLQATEEVAANFLEEDAAFEQGEKEEADAFEQAAVSKTKSQESKKTDKRTAKRRKRAGQPITRSTEQVADVSGPRSITGRVTSDADGAGLAGINVILKGTATGTVTDVDGNYTLNIPEGEESTIIFSYIGFTSLEAKTGDSAVLDVQLSEDVTQLSEVVITGYGRQADPEPEVMIRAKPVDGNAALKRFFEENLRYPEGFDVKGKVVLEFEVTTNGDVNNIRVIKSLGEEFDQEAIRLIQNGPKWKPTRRNNIPESDIVRVRIKFDPGK